MKKFFGTAFILTILICPLFLKAADPSALQTQIENVKREKDALLAEQRRLEAELNKVNQEANTLGTAVKSLDATKKKLTNDIALTQAKIKSTNLSISSLEQSMTKKEQQIVIHRQALAELLKQVSDKDSTSIVSDLLRYKNISEAWQDKGEVIALNGKLEEEIDSLRNEKQALDEEKDAKEKAKKEHLSLQAQLSGQKQVVEENQKEKAALLAQTKNKEAEYQKMLADNIARQKESEQDLFDLESQLKITLDPKLLPTPRRGMLSWPLDVVYITQKFGKTSGSARLYASGTHNGVDFRASVGTPVKAMLSGVVEGAGNTNEQKGCYSFGRWILIKHNNGLSSIYAHLSASIVKKGDTIETGQIIGYSGGMPGSDGAGYSTGPHLHVSVYASQGVEIQQFTTSINCKLVYVPIADVKAYLDPLAYLPPL